MENILKQELAHHDASVQHDADTIYYGRCASGCTGINDAKWNIIRKKKLIVAGKDIWVKTYSNGNETQNLKFTDYATIKYSHLK